MAHPNSSIIKAYYRGMREGVRRGKRYTDRLKNDLDEIDREERDDQIEYRLEQSDERINDAFIAS